MNAPKLHHYVPQFYLRRFTDSSGCLWLWDRDQDRAFRARPNSIAAEKDFYYLAKLVEHGHDPLTMEKQFSDLEGQAARIIGQWLDWLRQMRPEEKMDIPDINRELVSLFIALQFLRTADARDTLAWFVEKSENRGPLSPEERRAVHMDMLWDDEVFRGLANRIQKATWIFGRNTTATPFITSDNPVAFRTSDNAMWIKAGIDTAGTYVVYPLAPDIMMYCHPREGRWEKLAKFDRCLSPVTFTDSMVEGDNSAQVFMASRFVISLHNNFDQEREFAKSIETDKYARKPNPAI